MKLPSTLQHQFFAHAEREAERCKERLAARSLRLQELKKEIRLERIPEDDSWRSWRVAVIDGSNSPSTSERLGIRYGAFCAGYMIFEGEKRVEENYFSDSFSQDQTSSQDVAQKVLAMMRFRMERDIALQCLKEKDVDLILIDGSFFGFRADAYFIKGEVIDVTGFERGSNLTAEVTAKTLELLKSRKVVGVIKRTRVSALDGWVVWRYGDESRCVNSNDKHILASIMRPRDWFAYDFIFGSPVDFNYFSRMKAVYRYLVLQAKKKATPEDLLLAAKRDVRNHIKKSLGYAADAILRTARYYARCSNQAPFEFETPLNFEVKPLLAYFHTFHNPATGLPWPIDLIDEGASLPRGFTKEFVQEIEAELIRDPSIADKLALAEYFSYLNPQKEED